MNIEKKIKEELLEAAENTKGAEAFVLLILFVCAIQSM